MFAPTELIGVRRPIILTVDNGATQTRAARGGERLSRFAAYKTPRNYEQAIDTIADTAREVLGGERPDAIGFSVAGEVKDGRIVKAGKLHEYGWVGKPLAEDIAAATGVPVESVVVINDCGAGANAERIARLSPPSAPEVTGIEVPVLTLKKGEYGAFDTLSTGFGSALYREDIIVPDEPGHRFLRPGAICGDGQDGHAEAHVSGSGIELNRGVRGENIPHGDPRWVEIKKDFHDSVALTVDHHASEGREIKIIGFTGSVALGGPDMLGGLQRAMVDRYDDRAPRVEIAVFGEESGLYGAYFAADEVLKSGSAAVVYQTT